MLQNPVRVAALPFDVRPGDVAGNLDRALEGLEEAAEGGAALLLLPEEWTTSFLPHFSPEIRAESRTALLELHARARELGVLVGGSAPGGEGPKPTNEFHLLGPGGPRFPYRKRVLFSPSGEGRQCVAGVDPPFCLESPAGRLSGVICYDLRFPELTRHGARAGADLLLVPAQWPTPRCGILELLTRARAAENQCWVLSCNRAGRASLGDRRVLAFPGSALLADPLGDLVARSSDGDLLIAELTPESLVETRRRVPCARDARRAGLWATVEVPDSET